MPNTKKNILFLSSWYPNRVMPTLGNFVQKHAEAVALYDHVAAVFVCSDENNQEHYEVVESEIHGVKTVNVYYKKVKHKIPVISQLQKAHRYLKAHRIGLSVVRKHQKTIDLVHHNIVYPAGIVAWYLKKFHHIPYIITENWTGYLPSKNTKLGWLELRLSRMIANNADCITPVSNDLKMAMQGWGLGKKFEIVYNVTDTRLFHPEKKDHLEKVKFIHISTLDDAHKNISGMLRVIERLSKKRNDFEAWFIGDGDSRPHQQLAKELGILNVFAFFDGTKTTTEVAEIMRKGDCFLLFSNYENLPCVMVEAFASGLPIVSSTAGGIPEHVTEKHGFLVSPRDEAALEERLEQVIDGIKKKQYNPQFLHEYAVNNFSYEQVGKKFDDLYNRILQRN